MLDSRSGPPSTLEPSGIPFDLRPSFGFPGRCVLLSRLFSPDDQRRLGAFDFCLFTLTY